MPIQNILINGHPVPIGDPKAPAALIDYWQPRLTYQQLNQEAMDKMKHFGMKPSIDCKTSLTFEEFLEIINSAKDSAPGPDRVPYSFWTCATDSLTCHAIEGKDLEEQFNYAIMAFKRKRRR